MAGKTSPPSTQEHGASHLYEAIGGADGCYKLSAAFYARVDRDPMLRPLFPGTSLRCAIEEFAAFLIQFLGGPSELSQRRWWLSLHESHLRLKITPKHRDAWMRNMIAAFGDAQIEEPVRAILRGFFEHSSAYVVNHGQAPAVEHRIEELAPRWESQRKVDEAVAAIRSGNAVLAADLAESCDRSMIGGLLGLMIRTRDKALLSYVRKKLAGIPALVHERYGGRTLLHEAAAQGDSSTVELLLRLGADPSANSSGGHTPLYCLGNECNTPAGGSVVRILVAAGAKVDAADGVKRCTALHMAARRGNAEIAGALLDSGADIEARDSLGDTPLRRAVNCNKAEVAALFVARGADIRSVGSKRLTPLLAARSDAMRRVLTSSAS